MPVRSADQKLVQGKVRARFPKERETRVVYLQRQQDWQGQPVKYAAARYQPNKLLSPSQHNSSQ
jgi:hypothetical protein